MRNTQAWRRDHGIVVAKRASSTYAESEPKIYKKISTIGIGTREREQQQSIYARRWNGDVASLPSRWGNFCAQLELLENNMNMSSTQTHTNNPMVRSSHVTTEPGMTGSPSRPPILPSRSELEGEEFFVSSRQDKRVMMKKLREWWLHALTKSCYNQHLPVEACEREAHVLSKFIW